MALVVVDEQVTAKAFGPCDVVDLLGLTERDLRVVTPVDDQEWRAEAVDVGER